MSQRPRSNTVGELRELLAFVCLCYPDNFPDDEDREFGSQNMEEAFEDLHKDIEAVGSKNPNKAKFRRLGEMIGEAELLHKSGDVFGCSKMVQRVYDALRKKGKYAEAEMAPGPRPDEEAARLVYDSIAEAMSRLQRTGSLNPFARILLVDGRTEQLDCTETEQELYQIIDERLPRIRAAAVTVKGHYKPNDGSETLDAIMVDCDHREHKAFTHMLPYRPSESGPDIVITHKSPRIKARRNFFMS